MGLMQVLRHPGMLIGRVPLAAAAAAGLVGIALLSVHLLSSAPDAAPAVQLAAIDFDRHEHCVEHAHLVHDVRWAAACMQRAQQGEGDGIADCDLPGADAARLNALLDEAEQRCVAESRAAPLR